MIDYKNTTFQFDYENFLPSVKEGLSSGKMVAKDGVAYWAKGLEQTGIVQHLPIKTVQTVSQETFVQVMSGLQNTVVAAQAIATGTLMVAMAIQTQVLTKKIEVIQKMVTELSQDIQEQNVIFYADKASEYLGLLHSFKLFLDNRVNIKDIKPIAEDLLSSSIRLKNHLVYFIGNLINLLNIKKIKNLQHIELITQFIQQMMEILPMGMHLEFTLSHRLNNKEFSQILIENSFDTYSSLLTDYRSYLNNINNDIKNFRLEPKDVPFFEKIKQPALDLIQSSMVYELLERPAKEKISYST